MLSPRYPFLLFLPHPRLFQPERNLSINERIKLAFQDADIIPLFIQVSRLQLFSRRPDPLSRKTT